MSDAALEQQTPSHAAFLERLASAPSPTSARARHSHAAFVTLRLVDLLGPERAPLPAGAFQYQLAATERCCRDLPGDSTETAHLAGLLLAATDAYTAGDAQLVVPALLAYAHFLEDELRLPEALDVLETAARVGGDALRSADRVATGLRRARVLRKLNAFDAAAQAYDAAGALAAASGDRHSELLSRIGHANAVLGRGNLVEAEHALRQVLSDAEVLGDREAQARAHQGLAVVLVTRGQPADAIPWMWRAFQQYEDDSSRARALGDLGGMLLMVGDAEGATRALTEVVRREGTHDVANNAMIELMHCASYRRDRLAFERWRALCELQREAMPPSMLADFYYKSGIGRARFGQFERAELLLKHAVTVAEEAGLHEMAFRVERIKDGLRDCCQGCEAPPEAAAEPAFPNESVREVSAALAHLGT
jgi:tetratricopeptide (TPR) repeat protein